jgi:hypothetical protein
MGAYCRAIETYLCSNDGLVRVVGLPDCVAGWAARVCRSGWRAAASPLCRAHEAKGPRRRPVRVEFCDADVLDLFDEWRRAVGVPKPPRSRMAPPRTTDTPGGTRRSWRIDRVVAA